MFEIAGGIILAIVFLALIPVAIGIIGFVWEAFTEALPWLIGVGAFLILLRGVARVSYLVAFVTFCLVVLGVVSEIRRRNRPLKKLEVPSPASVVPDLSPEEQRLKLRRARRAFLRKKYADQMNPSE